MKVIQFVVNVSYNDISKLFSVLWVEAAYESLLNAVVQEFQIPSSDVSEKILCDLSGTPHTKDSFEEDVCRSISEGKVPQFRVISGFAPSNFVTASTNQSQCKEAVEQQEPEETDLSSRVGNILSNLSRIEDNFKKADNKLRQYETEIESNSQGQPQPAEATHHSNDPEVDIEELQREKENLDLFEIALLEFESRLKKRETTLNQRDIESNKLRQRLNRRNEKLSNREVKTICREREVAVQHHSLNQLEELLYGLSSHMHMTSKQMEEHDVELHMREAMLDEEKNNIKGCRKIVKSKERRFKMEVDANLDETQFNEGASTSNQHRSRELSKMVSMELEAKVSKQKRRGSESSGISDEQQAKQSGPSISLIDGRVISMDFNEATASADEPMKVNDRQTLSTTRKSKTKKRKN